MRIFNSGFKVALCALSSLIILGCGPEEPVTPTDTTVPVSEVSLNNDKLSVDVGATVALTATVNPSNATNKTVTWSSSNESVATVSNGTVTAVAPGKASIMATAGDKSATCVVTVKVNLEEPLKASLMKIYDALDGPNWKMTFRWDMSKPLSEWEYVIWDDKTEELGLEFYPGPVGLKGQLPDCFDELTCLTKLFIQNEEEFTGTLPPSFANLKKLKSITLSHTAMTSLPDLFDGMPLDEVFISGNPQMAGPLPASLASSSYLKHFLVMDNAFTGKVPDSYASLSHLGNLLVFREAHVDEHVPDSFISSNDAGYLINMYLCSSVFRTTPFMVGDYDIPAFWPLGGLKDLVTGQDIPFKEICASNKATVLLTWATWCPFSKELMPVLKKMYEKYHEDGLEIIAAFNADYSTQDGGKPLKDVILERGYDKWYNFNIWDFGGVEWETWTGGATPSAVVVDKNGNIITSSRSNVLDPARNRFGYLASSRLIPILENIFGPLEGDDNYSSTDYSQDGKVITIQKASFGKGINLVFMGDAYTDKDIASGLYERMMWDAAEEFFSIEPYKSFRDRFNVYAVKVVSKNGQTGKGYETALNASMVNGAAVTGNADIVYEYARKVPGITDRNLTVAVLVNSIYHGGVADMSESLQSGIGYFSSLCNDPEGFGPVLRHEVGGHAFAFLADEYANHNGSPSQALIDETTRKYNTYGWYSNIDFTNDPSKVKWADFLKDSRYKDEVGIYEGANDLKNGIYRPSQNSMMKDNLEYYNAPSRWAIYKRIMELSGETASFSKFLEYDAINRGH